MPRLIDLSHTVEDGMITYKGLPAPIICDFLSREASRRHYAPGVEFQIGKIEMVANTGTYLDSPFHRYPDGNDLSQLDLATVAELDGVDVHSEPAALLRDRARQNDLVACGAVDLLRFTGRDVTTPGSPRPGRLVTDVRRHLARARHNPPSSTT